MLLNRRSSGVDKRLIPEHPYPETNPQGTKILSGYIRREEAVYAETGISLQPDGRLIPNGKSPTKHQLRAEGERLKLITLREIKCIVTSPHGSTRPALYRNVRRSKIEGAE